MRNDTPNIIESGTNQVVVQAMTATVASPSTGASAGLYAIARYHRNPCYKTNLTGERTYDNTTGAAIEPVGCASMRTDYQEISISKPKVVTAADLNASSSTPMAFDFSNDPIPVNATDLIVQVVYRGQLGEETDGIAVGSIDVREPGYLTAFNSTDWGACGGQWVQVFMGGCTPSSGTTRRRVNSATMCVARQPLLFYNAGTPAGLEEGEYLRVAVLSDGQPLNTRLRGLYNNISPAINTDRSFVGPIRQGAKEIPSTLEPFVSELFFSKRGRLGNNRAIPLYLLSGMIDPQPSNDLGALDVGNRLPAFSLSELPRPADFSFLDTPNVIAICN